MKVTVETALTEQLAKAKRASSMVVQRGRDGSALVAVVTIVDEEFAAIKAIENFTPCPGDSAFFYRNKIADEQYDVILAQSADRSNTPCAELVSGPRQ